MYVLPKVPLTYNFIHGGPNSHALSKVFDIHIMIVVVSDALLIGRGI